MTVGGEQISLGNGQTLHRWTNSDGNGWACAAYDHGPFCRLCQPVDGILDACLQNVLDGVLTLRQNPDGQFVFRVTEEGQRRAEHLIATNPELADLWERLSGEQG